MRRRHLLVLAAAATATPAAADTARPRVNFAPTVSIGGPTEGSLYFTRDNPGIWASEADRHLPRIEIEPAPGSTTGLTVTTDHPMEGCRHYILKHKVLDWHFRLISQKTFDPAKDRPFRAMCSRPATGVRFTR